MQPRHPAGEDAVNYYTVLGLPRPSLHSPTVISKDEVKTAYHLTLLLNHPDKASRPENVTAKISKSNQNDKFFTIDEIMRAYQTLSDSKLKAEYDKQLLSDSESGGRLPRQRAGEGTHLGVETYDLDDLEFDEERSRWLKSCRCGIDEAYVITEAELEQESKVGEIYVGCRGCSLFIKVLFSLAEAATGSP